MIEDIVNLRGAIELGNIEVAIIVESQFVFFRIQTDVPHTEAVSTSVQQPNIITRVGELISCPQTTQTESQSNPDSICRQSLCASASECMERPL